mmetsp:Transcript_2510/g.8084  ORF Transcript_2510/g.8084 Transcript_2510/m.8084 type:complete len:244 (+) Transcript_2510:438-1169(+)
MLARDGGVPPQHKRAQGARPASGDRGGGVRGGRRRDCECVCAGQQSAAGGVRAQGHGALPRRLGLVSRRRKAAPVPAGGEGARGGAADRGPLPDPRRRAAGGALAQGTAGGGGGRAPHGRGHVWRDVAPEGGQGDRLHRHRLGRGDRDDLGGVLSRQALRAAPAPPRPLLRLPRVVPGAAAQAGHRDGGVGGGRGARTRRRQGQDRRRVCQPGLHGHLPQVHVQGGGGEPRGAAPVRDVARAV